MATKVLHDEANESQSRNERKRTTEHNTQYEQVGARREAWWSWARGKRVNGDGVAALQAVLGHVERVGWLASGRASAHNRDVNGTRPRAAVEEARVAVAEHQRQALHRHDYNKAQRGTTPCPDSKGLNNSEVVKRN